MCRICYKNKQKIQKIKKLFTENEELNQIVLGKGPFTLIKQHLCLTKGYLDNLKGQVDIKFPLIESCF